MHKVTDSSISRQLGGNILFVDAIFGDDQTAEPFNGNLPYASIKAALKKVRCLNLDTVLEIFIRPGTYSEGKLKLVDNVSVRGSGRLATIILGSIDTSKVQGSASTMLELTIISTEEPALIGDSSGQVSFRMVRLESNYFSKRDDQSTVVISPVNSSSSPRPPPRPPCAACIVGTTNSSHVITDSEVILNSTGGADLKVFDHRDGSLELERNTHQLNVSTLLQVQVTTTPFEATQDNVEYVLQQATEFRLPSRPVNSDPIGPAVGPVLRNIQITQATGGPSNLRSRVGINGQRSISAGQTVAISQLIILEYRSQLVNPTAPSIPTNLRIYAVGGATRKGTQIFRGLNNRSLIESNNQLFETSNLKIDNTPQPALPVIPVTTSPYSANQDNAKYVVTATSFRANAVVLESSQGIQGVPVLNNVFITSQTQTETILFSDAPITGPTTLSFGQTIQASIGNSQNYVTAYVDSADNPITAKQVGESHALNVPRVPILNSNRLINTPGIQGFQLQPPAGGGQLVFRLGRPTNGTFVALHLFVPQNAIGSLVQTVENTFFTQNQESPVSQNIFATNAAQNEGQFKVAGLYGIDDSLSLGFWTVRYLGFPNALTRVNDSAPELPPQISINTPTLETGESIETLLTSESKTATIHVNQVSVFNTRQIPAINHPKEARNLVSVQQVSTQYEHLRGGSQIESTTEQLGIGDRIDNIASLNVRTIILGGSNTLILPDIIPFGVPALKGVQVAGGTHYLVLQGKAVVGSSVILSGFFNPIFISGQSTSVQPLNLALDQNVEFVATYPTGATTGTNGFWVANVTTVSV